MQAVEILKGTGNDSAAAKRAESHDSDRTMRLKSTRSRQEIAVNAYVDNEVEGVVVSGVSLLSLSANAEAGAGGGLDGLPGEKRFVNEVEILDVIEDRSDGAGAVAAAAAAIPLDDEA